MLKEIQKLPVEMQKAYKKVADRPDENTPPFVLDFLTDDRDQTLENYFNIFKVNQIVDFADAKLLDLDLDEKTDNKIIYNEFAMLVVSKIVSTVDVETQKSKPLKLYDNNQKVKRLRARDFSTIGNIEDMLPLAKAALFAKFYEIENDEEYLELSPWEKRLFADKVQSRQKIESEKN